MSVRFFTMTSSFQRVASAQLQLVEHEQQQQRLLLLVVLHDCLARSSLHSHRHRHLFAHAL